MTTCTNMLRIPILMLVQYLTNVAVWTSINLFSNASNRASGSLVVARRGGDRSIGRRPGWKAASWSKPWVQSIFGRCSASGVRCKDHQSTTKVFIFSQLSKELPPRTIGRTWNLAYSTSRHGASLKTLYRKLSASDSPVLIVIKDALDEVNWMLWKLHCYLKMRLISYIKMPLDSILYLIPIFYYHYYY